jgi:hypothetical protein
LTINRTNYEAVLTQITATQVSLTTLNTDVNTADSTNTFGSIFTNILAELTTINTWAANMVLQADQEVVMTDFLSELKAVFDKYTAEIEVGSAADGYGTSYGGGGNVGIKLSAMLNGVIATKEINKAVIVGGDLV